MGTRRDCQSESRQAEQSVSVTEASHHFYCDIKFNKNYLPNLISVIQAVYVAPRPLSRQTGGGRGGGGGGCNDDGLATMCG